MTRLLITAFCVFGLVLAAQAQDEPRRERPDGDRPQMREGRGPGFGPSGMVERMAERLNLDESQRKQFDEIAAKYQERFDQQRQRWQELREAQSSGDEARAEELRAKMRDEGPGSRGNPMEAMIEEIKPILNEEQLGRLDEMRQQFAGGRGMMGLPDERSIDQLKEELQLDDEQAGKFDEIAGRFKRDLEESRNRMMDMGNLYRELREARDNGEDDRVREIETKIGEMRPDRDRMMNKLFEQIEPILHEEQMEKFNAAKERLSRRGGSDDSNDPRSIFRVTRRLDLDDHQREQIRAMEEDVNEQLRKAREGDRDEYRRAQSELTEQVKKDIKALLEPEQVQRFEEELSRMDRDSRRGGRDRERGRDRDRGERRDPR